VADCTFRPAINRHSDRLMADRSIVLRVRQTTQEPARQNCTRTLLLAHLLWVQRPGRVVASNCAVGSPHHHRVQKLQLLREMRKISANSSTPLEHHIRD
jgi:hypothetical protein